MGFDPGVFESFRPSCLGAATSFYTLNFCVFFVHLRSVKGSSIEARWLEVGY